MFPLLLLAAGCCLGSTDMRSLTVLQGSVASLPCPHRGDVTWSRLDGSGARVPLVRIRGGLDTPRSGLDTPRGGLDTPRSGLDTPRSGLDTPRGGLGQHRSGRYSSLADNSLVITNVLASDSKAYLCNDTPVYLHVTTDPNQVIPSAGNEPDTQGSNQPAADWWRVPVGVIIGAVLVLSGICTVRFCSKHTSSSSNPPDGSGSGSEVVYEEIRAAAEQPAGDSYFESPYYSASISGETNSCTDPSHNNLYSTVSRGAEGAGECVYSLAQDPLQPGSNDQ